MNWFQQVKSNHFLYSTALLLVVLPFSKLVVPVMILTIISWLWNEPFSEKIKNLKTNWMALVFALPFFAYLIGMLHSENVGFGWRDIELKLSLFIFPLVFGSTSFPLYKYKKSLALLFVYSSAISGLLSIIYGAVTYHQIPTYGMMDLLLHPSYLSMYLNVAIVLFFFLVIRSDLQRTHSTLLKIAFLIISVTIWLCLSKSGILVWCIMVFGMIIYNSYVKKKFKSSIWIVLFGGVAIASTVFLVPEIKNRFLSLISVSFEINEVNKSTAESSQVRILIWDQALEVIQENPLKGTGTGDIKDELYLKYEAAGMTGALENKLNVHNQYLQVFATLGLFGFLVFLVAFVLPAIKAIQRKYRIYLAFILVVSVNFMSESILEKQDGVVFYSFLNALLFFILSQNTSRATESAKNSAMKVNQPVFQNNSGIPSSWQEVESSPGDL